MKKLTESPLKLNRETLRALAPAPVHEEGFATITSTCKSGWTCCNN